MTKGTKQPDQPLVRPVVWIASSKDDLETLPHEVRGSFGFRLYELQQGKTPLDSKPLPQIGSGVYELRESFDRNAYRMINIVNRKKTIYVLHAFIKIQVRRR